MANPWYQSVACSKVATLLRCCVGFLLIASGVLKAFSPLEAVATIRVFAIPFWLLTLAVQVELFLGVMLVCGVCQKWSLRASSALFVVFAAFSIYLALGGYGSCGCFGAVKLHPWFTAILDIVVLGVLAFLIWIQAHRQYEVASRIGAVESPPQSKTFGKASAMCLYLGVGILCIYSMASLRPNEATSNESIAKAGDLFVLEPQKWIDKRFPLDAHLVPTVDTSSGQWTVVIYHHDCSDCQVAIPQYVALANDVSKGQVLLVEMPPLGENKPTLGKASYAHLSSKLDWFVQAPVEIAVEDGIVKLASLELPGINNDCGREQ